MSLWRPGKPDIAPLLLIVLLPLALTAPQYLGGLQAEPAVGAMALGKRAAMDWLSGTVPWWNPYGGVGLPLAAEYRSAAFSPLTMLLLLPKGAMWLQLALVILSGLGTYGLLSQMGLGRVAVVAGAIGYAVVGTLAWFFHGSAAVVPFLPWMLWGIERARAKAQAGFTGGWRMLALAMAMSFVASSPETACIGALLALGWAILRGFETPREGRVPYARRVVAGGLIGVAIAMPRIYSFLEYLPQGAASTWPDTRGNMQVRTVSRPAIAFLHDNLGLQRFHAFDAFQPDDGAMFGIASTNHGDRPVSRRWAEWVRVHLDGDLRRNLAEYEWLGVKYVVVAAGRAPFAAMPTVKRAYADAQVEIYELPEPKPYFEALQGSCFVREQDRARILLQCARPATLVRRELFFPGWTASVNGEAAAIALHRDLFQAVPLRPGMNEVRYRYAPPYAGWAWLVCFAGLLALALSFTPSGVFRRRSK